MKSIKDKIEEYVSKEIAYYKPRHIRAPKVIHDAILGSNLFYPYEIAILDLPIVQRLRKIGQTDVASLIFPSGNHNRFEHTLGVAVIADKIARSLKSKYNSAITDDDIRNVRLAAIMHDCGHGPFSHISEEVYKYCQDFLNEKESNIKLQNCNAHEALSYLIVTSQAFRNSIKEIEDEYNITYDLDLIGNMIIGYIDNTEKSYLIEIINGAFDADKLDYIQRDSHFTGIKMVLDLDRLYHKIDILRDREGYNRLSVEMSGVSTLEQIVFNKMLLYNTVYHHHKVRAAESIFTSIFEEIKSNKLQVNGLSFHSAVDFLYLTDVDIYSLSRRLKSDRVKMLANSLCLRNLPQRAMVLSPKTVTPNTLKNLEKILKLYDNPNKKRDFRESIADEAKHSGCIVLSDDIWVDIPRNPKFEESIRCPIKSPGSSNDYVLLRDIMPIKDWVTANVENKSQAHVFAYPEHREQIFKATRDVLQKKYGVEVNDYAYLYCKIPSELED